MMTSHKIGRLLWNGGMVLRKTPVMRSDLRMGEAEAEAEEIGPIDSKALRDAIAEAMWSDYQGHLQARGEI